MSPTLEFEDMLVLFIKDIWWNLVIHRYKRALAPPTIEVVIELRFPLLLHIHMEMGYPPLISQPPLNHTHQCIQLKGCPTKNATWCCLVINHYAMSQIHLLHEKVKWWMGWSKKIPKVKHDCLHGQRRGRRQTWTKHKDKGSFGCHHLPPLCSLWMVQVGKVDTTKFAKCELKIVIMCLHTLSLLAKS